MSDIDEKLKRLRRTGAFTVGLSAEFLCPFLKSDTNLHDAIADAYENFIQIEQAEPELLERSEEELIRFLQDGILNFYDVESASPYIPLAAQGPWIITLFGAVLYDTGGYGIMGQGHNPQKIREVLAQKAVMASVLTPSISQRHFVTRMRAAIGKRAEKCPYESFACLNSGSEAMTLAMRLCDVNAKTMTDPGGRHAGSKIYWASMHGSFHGRTENPARVSDSSQAKYQVLASFRDRKDLLTVETNSLIGLQNLFERAAKEKIFISAVLLEPVMGEGRPGVSISRIFYDLARKLTADHGAFLIIDSIQAGIRAHGCLSIVDYPEMEGIVPPDIETFSKAINAGQYPLSVTALSPRAKALYRPSLYGNTMTAMPRALEVGAQVLDLLTPTLAENIERQGRALYDGFIALQHEFPTIIEGVDGTGLLIGVHLNEKTHPVNGRDGVEQYMRKAGINLIHGGKNALRYTPTFGITDAEVQLILDVLRFTLRNYA